VQSSFKNEVQLAFTGVHVLQEFVMPNDSDRSKLEQA
jgi:hypothetical protein